MKLLAILIAILFQNICTAQSTFVVKTGKKANYTLEIPKEFTAMEAIGANVDLKFVDKNGASINTVVKKLPAGVKESQIIEMSYPSDATVKEQLEAQGLEEVKIIKRGMTLINGVNTYYQYYTTNVDGTTLYYHSINQFRKGNMIVLTFACQYSEKHNYMAYINRTINSLTHK